MRLKDYGDSLVLWLSADDTRRWARKAGACWPCSTLEGHRIVATFDGSGLLDLGVDGKGAPEDLDSNEFNAVTADFLERRLSKEHPCYFVTVGQFRARGDE